MSDAPHPPEVVRLQPATMEEILADALAIQDRFAAEPHFKSTGEGVLKSRGANAIAADAEELRQKLGRAGELER